MIIGIDVGGSTTKIVGIDKGCVKYPLFVKANDPVTSLFGAFGKYLYDNSIPLSDVEQVVMTGVGSSYVKQPLYGLPTARTDEFMANGLNLTSSWFDESVTIDGREFRLRTVGAVP